MESGCHRDDPCRLGRFPGFCAGAGSVVPQQLHEHATTCVLGRDPMLFGANLAFTERSKKAPSPPLNSVNFGVELTSGGEGTCLREAISAPNSIGSGPACGAKSGVAVLHRLGDGEFVAAFVFGVAAVAFHDFELHLVSRQ